jgi:hypothetical protein
MRAESQSPQGEAGEFQKTLIVSGSFFFVISVTRSFNFLLSSLKSLPNLSFPPFFRFFFSFCMLQNQNKKPKSKQFSIPSRRLRLCFTCKNPTTIHEEIDQINPAFNIHHIPSSISLDTPSERSTSAEPSNHDQSKSNLPNGNLPKFSPQTVLTISSESEPAPTRKLSKLTIMEPLDSIC